MLVVNFKREGMCQKGDTELQSYPKFFWEVTCQSDVQTV